MPRVGDRVPAAFQLFNYDTGKFVRAFVRDATNTQITGSPVNLTQIALGLYVDSSLTMPNTAFVTVQYVTYDDSGHTVISTTQGAGLDVLERVEDSTGGNMSLGYVVGVIDSAATVLNGIQDTVIQGADRTLNIRLVLDSNGYPFNLTGETLIEVVFLKADSTLLTIRSTDVSVPITIVSAAVGNFTVNLTAAQTALLMVQTPAAFSVSVTQPAGVTLVNFPYQLSVVEQLPDPLQVG